MRYGENPHQQAALYSDARAAGANLVTAKQLHGKELSYNNLLDLDSALAIVRDFDAPAAAVIKHNNPCGAAVAGRLDEALRRALAGDPLSAFGSVLGLNRRVDAATAEVLAAPGLFVEAVVAPDFEPEALEILTTKPKWKANVRLMKVGDLDRAAPHWTYRRLEGGMLVQEADVLPDPEDQWKVVTDAHPAEAQMADLRLAWALVRHVKSNAIVVAKDRMLLGAGAGQMSRVDSVEIAIRKAGDRVRGAVLASDAFFPFPDSIDEAAAAGVAALIQPGGSRNDDQCIAACNQPRPAHDLHRPPALQTLRAGGRMAEGHRFGIRLQSLSALPSADVHHSRPDRCPKRREVAAARGTSADELRRRWPPRRRRAISWPPWPAAARSA